jgi:hypothetical protein
MTWPENAAAPCPGGSGGETETNDQRAADRQKSTETVKPADWTRYVVLCEREAGQVQR